MNLKIKLGLLLGGALAATAALAQGLAILTTLTGTEIIPLASGTVSSGISATNLAIFTKAASVPLVATTGVFSGVLTPTGGLATSGGGPSTPRGQYTCAQGAISTTTPGTDTTPVNTETYIDEVFIDGNETITGVALFNGSAVAGNVTIGLANATTGVPIAAAKSASTAQSGTAAYQLIPFAVPYVAVGPATYLVLAQFDTNATPRYRSHAIGTCGASKKTAEVYGTFTTVTPPTTFTTGVGAIAGLY